MLRNKPRLKYCGLTVILSNPSRFDTINLLSGPAGHLFSDFCLRPEYNSMQCDIRVTEDKSPFLPDTKCVLLLGETAMYEWVPESRSNVLNEVRGSLFSINGIPAIASFIPQEAADIKAHERALNPLSKDYAPDDSESSDDDDEGDVKALGRTKRSNYAFWLRADIRKCKEILKHGIPAKSPQPEYRIYPNSDEVIQVLSDTKGQHLYFDIETDYEEQNLQCFSFTFCGRIVYCVPVLDFNYNPAYTALAHIMRALATSIKNNTLVAHNGANFDFLVLGYKYRIPVYSVYDTMVAMHRCFPDVEKSLGHCTSYWTWERFHKDEDSRGYMTKDQMIARLKYCGKDVFTMFLIHNAIKDYARRIVGLDGSINAAMDSIVPYLTTTLTGISYDHKKVEEQQKENDELMTQYLRCISILIGESSMLDIRKAIKGKAKGFAGSNTQCCEYFHNMLGYPVMARSQKTGKPSLGKKAMFKLALQHDNPVIRFVLAYRDIAKEYGTLKFVPWKDDSGKIINHREYVLAHQ